ncbi:MAG: DUF1080 domain-containing protein [Saprospiraceae bacterium]|nr:DUF1080 domain-containing protein [Saprospiraceae bacterium]
MKQIIASIIISFFLLGNNVFGQEKLDTILQHLPANSSAELELYMNQLIALGAPGVVTMSSRLQGNVSSKNDLKERYALSGLAKHLGDGQDQETQRTIETGYLQALKLGLDLEVEVFLIEQLQYLGSDQSVETLASKLLQVCEPAVQTLSQIGSATALSTLIKALDDHQGYCKFVIAKAIGKFEQADAISQMVKLSGDGDSQIRLVALQSLACSTSASAMAPLLNFAKTDQKRGNDLLIRYAQSQAEHGQTKDLTTISDQVLSSGDALQKSMVIKLLAKYTGEDSQKILFKGLTKGSVEETRAVTSSLAANPSLEMDTYFKSFSKISTEAQIGLLMAATERAYKPALPEAKSLLSSREPQLQVAAIKTVSQLSGVSSIAELQNILTSSENPMVVKTAIAELSRWVSSQNIEVISLTLDRVPGKNKAQMIKLVGDRGISSLFAKVEGYLLSTDSDIRKAAFDVIPDLVKDASVNDLMALVSIAETPEELASVRKAFTNKVGQFENTEEMIIPLLNTFGESSPGLLSKILPAIGGKSGLEYIKKQTDRTTLVDWSTPEAIPDLFTYLASTDRRDPTFASIIRLINHPMLPADQRVLYLRKLMPLCINSEEKERVIRSLGDTKSHTAFMYVKDLLQDDELKLAAANTLLRLALPAAGESLGLFGEDIKRGLMQADTQLNGQTDGYSDSFLNRYLTIMPEEGGFISMFNGVDLIGWQGLVENPLIRDTMFTLDLKARQIEADAKIPNSWKIENGVITFFGEGYDNLCSVKPYRDFELLVDWKITKKGDSGIYLRGSPQVQIWDTSMVDIGAQVGSGGLYNNQINESKPLCIADNPVGEWNTFRITMIQDKVTVYLNGVLVTDHTVLENYWNRELPIFREGPIELQAHGSNLQFRDIYVRELPSAPDLSDSEISAGFQTIFNGINLDGWVGNKTDYVVENGEIIIYPGGSGGSGNLFTEKEYDNFILRFEFMLTPGANNGLGIHAPLEGDAAYLGKEIQILDNSSPIYAELKDYQYHGSVYGIVPAKKGELKPVGEWNSQEVSVKGNQIWVILNGRRILFDDLNNATRNGTLDGKEHPGLQKLKGHIGFLGHGSEVHFRNIRIKQGNF